MREKLQVDVDEELLEDAIKEMGYEPTKDNIDLLISFLENGLENRAREELNDIHDARLGGYLYDNIKDVLGTPMPTIPEGYRATEGGENLEKLREDGVLDGLCYCGALQSKHGDNGPAKGHGAHTKTGCKKFTWAMFVVKTN